jgi:transcription antitermination factor NusG
MNNCNKVRLEMRRDQMGGYIFIEFEDSNEHNGIAIEIGVKSEEEDSGWSYIHVLQETKGVLISGVADGIYTLSLKQNETDSLKIKYTVELGDEKKIEMEEIPREGKHLEIEIGDDLATRQFGGTFGGALLTSGSFTMMAASGGF